jgi:hypothetical protein
MAKSKKSKSRAGIFDIFINGIYVDKVCANNQAHAVEKYKQGHPTETGTVSAKWVSPAPISVDCDEYIRKLRELEKAEAAAIGKRDDVPIA